MGHREVKFLRGPRRSTPHHYSEVSLRSSPQMLCSEDIKRLMLYCEVCYSNIATKKCPVCGRYVCEEHWSRNLGLCTICAMMVCRVCWRNLAVTRCSICGRIVCRECIVEVDEVRRKCFLCVMRSGNSNML